MQVPILSGIFTDSNADVRQSFPVNMVPVGLENGVSGGFLRPAPGLVQNGTGSGATRGQIEWRGTLYAVHGVDLVSIAQDGTILVLGTVAAGGTVTMDYDFDVLGIAAGGFLYYWDGSSLTQVTDPDVGVVVDCRWLQGFWWVTDGEVVRTSELNDRTSFGIFDYAVPEQSPDDVVALLRTRNQMAAVGATTIEIFDNQGTPGFPFAPIFGAQIQKGCVGTHACCIFLEAIAFVGGGRNESPGVYLGSGGQTQKVSTREIDQLIAAVPAVDLVDIVVEARNDVGQQLLYIHLPDRTLMFDALASQKLGAPAWSVQTSTLVDFAQYRARHFVWCYGRWNVADPTSVVFGYLSDAVSDHYGAEVRTEWATMMLYNESRGAIVDTLELVCLPGRCALGADPQISSSYSLDGQTWSEDRSISAGMVGDRRKRLQWRRDGSWRNVRMQRFRSTSTAHLSVLRLEAAVSPLAW